MCEKENGTRRFLNEIVQEHGVLASSIRGIASQKETLLYFHDPSI